MPEFPTNYSALRALFAEQVAAAHWQHEFWDYPLSTLPPATQGSAEIPASCRLGIDVAFSTPDARLPTLLVTSGLHGVELPLGAAVQRVLLRQWRDQPGWRCVMLHGLNPWGSFHGRRTDAQNIDLNRNFSLVDRQQAADPRAVDLHRLLNPRKAPGPGAGMALMVRLLGWSLRLGRRQGAQLIAAGQSHDAQGLFYTGQQFSWTVQTLMQRLPKLLSKEVPMLHVDLHTGLGPWGQAYAIAEAGNRWGADLLTSALGDRLRWSDLGAEVYQASGTFCGWMLSQAAAGSCLSLCMEAGTYPPLRVLRQLVLENLAWHHLPVMHPRREKLHRSLLNTFAPTSPTWRDRAVASVVDAVSRLAEAWHRQL